MKKNIFTFEEAIQLLNVGALGFRFQSQRGDTFTTVLDLTERVRVIPVMEEGELE
jgi:hypothetical protein